MISNGEFYIGQVVTVLDNKPHINEDYDNFNHTVVQTKTIDRSGMGDLLIIVAVSLPYIAARLHNSEYIHKYDTRRSSFMEPSVEYIQAFNPKLAQTVIERAKELAGK